jgi:ADP-heptose:LPS heptosyltransferase
MPAPRILVLRGGAIGDGVLTFPIFQALRERWPAARIEVATYPRLAPVLLRGGLADACPSLEAPDFARLFSFRPEFSPVLRDWVADADLALNLLYDPDELVSRHLRDLGVRQVLSLDPRPPPGRHAADHLTSILHALALYPDPAVPALEWPTPTPAELRPGTLLLHPGSGSPRKNWPTEAWLTLGRTLRSRGVAVAVLAGEAEADWPARAAEAGLPCHQPPHLAALCDLLVQARAFLGHDSGPTHLAAALGRPVTALFGPTDPAQWAPRGRAPVRLLRAGDDWASLSADTVLEAVLADLA